MAQLAQRSLSSSAQNHLDDHNQLASKANYVFDVTDYGAVGDGATDDTAAIQAAFDAAHSAGTASTTTRVSLGKVVAPPGAYLTTAPIVVQSVQGLDFEGAGIEHTSFVPQGTFDSVFEFDGIAYSRVGGFTITSEETHHVDAAIKIEWTTAASRSTTQNEFHHIMIHQLDCRTGFGIGLDSTDRQVDQETFYKCTVSGGWTTGEVTDWQYGFESGNGTNANILTHNFIECVMSSWRYGVAWLATSGHWHGGSIGFNGSDFYISGAVAEISIRNVRSETSEKFLECAGPASNVRSMAIDSVWWSADALESPYTFMTWKLAGTLTLSNVIINNAAGDPKLVIDSGGELGVTLINCASDTPVESFITDSTSSAWSALFLGYTELNGTGGTAPKVTSIFQQGESTAAGIGFYGATPVALQTGVAESAAGIHAALVNLGLITA